MMLYLIPYLFVTAILACIFTDKFSYMKAFLILALGGIVVGLLILICIPSDVKYSWWRCEDCKRWGNTRSPNLPPVQCPHCTGQKIESGLRQ